MIDRETENRTSVALRLADVLARHGATPDTAAVLPALGWRVVAELAGCRPGYEPSTATRACVVSVLRSRHTAATASWASDPFRVFGR